MSHLKISELFYSIQGEGRFMGVPSVFLRTFGCNFTCGGFGMPRGELSQERIKIAALDAFGPYANYKELPLVSTGCDSYASWDPAFKHLSPMLDTNTIADSICEMLPFNEWRDEHLVITGGEPLLGWQRAYPDLIEHPKMNGLNEITFETNGTQPLTDEFTKYLKTWNQRQYPHGSGGEITFSVSPKLPGSGEKWEDAICTEIVRDYENVGFAYLKFVVASEEDAQDALKATAEYRAAGFKGPVYLMPVGGTEKVYEMNNRNVALFAIKHGLRYSDRLQVPLFKNEWGT
jgi:organic radical activating enzyme